MTYTRHRDLVLDSGSNCPYRTIHVYLGNVTALSKRHWDVQTLAW
jgi:hypothetical protein